MFYTPREIEGLYQEERPFPRLTELKKKLAEIQDEIIDDTEAYKEFGASWWQVKALFRKHLQGKRCWFHNNYFDPAAAESCDYGDPALSLFAACRYRDLFRSQGRPYHSPKDFQITEDPQGRVSLYSVVDYDAGRQMDLFEELSQKEAALEAFLHNVQDYVPRIWLNRGDEALRDGDFDVAVVCFQRMFRTASSEDDEAEAWLRLGMSFEQKGHFNKAVFAYKNHHELSGEPWILGNIASVYAQAENWIQAFDYYARACRQTPGNPEYETGRRLALEKIESLELSGKDRPFQREKALFSAEEFRASRILDMKNPGQQSYPRPVRSGGA